MRAVLGVDAAWTENSPSGVALCVERRAGWHCVAVAPSYADFVGLAAGRSVDWTSPRVSGGLPDPRHILRAAHAIAPRANVQAIAIDIPLARGPITGRRHSDQEVSRAFGNKKCGTHSPSPTRPGVISAMLRDGFRALGYPLATTLPARAPTIFEAYPHPALVSLLSAPERLQYKVSKAHVYWPDSRPEFRQRKLLECWHRILRVLRRHMKIDLELPATFRSLSAMKRYEDALDAVVCAWVAMTFLAGSAVPFGDSEAAIWIPRTPPASNRLSRG